MQTIRLREGNPDGLRRSCYGTARGCGDVHRKRGRVHVQARDGAKALLMSAKAGLAIVQRELSVRRGQLGTVDDDALCHGTSLMAR